MCILTGCVFFWNVCGSEIMDEIGTVFSMTGVGDLCGTDLDRSCSGLFTLECCGNDGGGVDACRSIGFSS